MTKREIVLDAGKRIAAIAAGRAFRESPSAAKPEDLMSDPSLPRQGQPPKPSPSPDAEEEVSDPPPASGDPS